jgi:ABC-type multidrug transport system fused ATPase/permease subunit
MAAALRFLLRSSRVILIREALAELRQRTELLIFNYNRFVAGKR